MFSETAEKGSNLWLEDHIHSSTKKMETAWLVVVGNPGVADHTSKTGFIITFISVALSQPEKTH